MIGYRWCIIVGFRHRGLQRLFVKGDRRRVAPQIVAKVERVLARLDVATGPADMDLPGFPSPPIERRTGRVLVSDRVLPIGASCFALTDPMSAMWT